MAGSFTTDSQSLHKRRFLERRAFEADRSKSKSNSTFPQLSYLLQKSFVLLFDAVIAIVIAITMCTWLDAAIFYPTNCCFARSEFFATFGGLTFWWCSLHSPCLSAVSSFSSSDDHSLYGWHSTTEAFPLHSQPTSECPSQSRRRWCSPLTFFFFYTEAVKHPHWRAAMDD